MALTQAKAFPIKNIESSGESYKVAGGAGAFAFGGSMMGTNASGYLRQIPGPGVNNSAFRFRGVSHRDWDNTGGSNGDFQERVDRPRIITGVQNLTGDPVTIADVGNQVFAEDDNTIRRTSNTNTRCPVGILYAVDSDGTVEVKLAQP